MTWDWDDLTLGLREPKSCSESGKQASGMAASALSQAEVKIQKEVTEEASLPQRLALLPRLQSHPVLQEVLSLALLECHLCRVAYR